MTNPNGRAGANIVGLDLSLTATGVYCHDDEYGVLKSKHTGMTRLDDLRARITDHTLGAALVVIEGYSMGTARQSSHAHGLGELGGLVRWSIWSRYQPYVDVPPASLKKGATGKGNASKDDVTGAAIRMGCPSNDNNVCDAWHLRQMGLYALGLPCAWPKTAYRDEAIAKIAWPDVSVAT